MEHSKEPFYRAWPSLNTSDWAETSLATTIQSSEAGYYGRWRKDSDS